MCLDLTLWLGGQDPIYNSFGEVIRTSTRDQLLPREGRMCGVAQAGFHPAIVEHAMWDYGRWHSCSPEVPEQGHRGGRFLKGHLNGRNFFGAPVASLFRMLERRKFGFPSTLIGERQERNASLLAPEV